MDADPPTGNADTSSHLGKPSTAYYTACDGCDNNLRIFAMLFLVKQARSVYATRTNISSCLQLPVSIGAAYAVVAETILHLAR